MKCGFFGEEWIVDWIVLNVYGIFFFDVDENNFGVDMGFVEYDFVWNVGDWFLIIFDGFFDFFGDGLCMVVIGVIINCFEFGLFYLGFCLIEGFIISSIIFGLVFYCMSEKWIVSVGMLVDLGLIGNIG